jgi:hypothetical protein
LRGRERPIALLWNTAPQLKNAKRFLVITGKYPKSSGYGCRHGTLGGISQCGGNLPGPGFCLIHDQPSVNDKGDSDWRGSPCSLACFQRKVKHSNIEHCCLA